MNEKYIKLYKSFVDLDVEAKKDEIIKILKETINVLYLENNKTDKYHDYLLDETTKYDDEEFLNKLFICALMIREENDNLIERIEG